MTDEIKRANNDDAAHAITVVFNDSGVGIRESTVKLIIDKYIEYKKQVLLNGDEFDDGLEIFKLSMRRVNAYSGSVIPMMKPLNHLTDEFKKDSSIMFCKNEKFREKATPDNTELATVSELEYLRRKFKVVD